jgi:hypothetical protein
MRQAQPQKSKPWLPGAGDMLRFVKIFWYLRLTYDFYSLDADQILELLPPEFDRYRPSNPS